MPSGPKKRRAQKKKNEAAAKREKTENEAKPAAISEENSPVMQNESTDGVTAVFDEPSVVLPKRKVLPEKILASEALDLKRKNTEEGIEENALPVEISSSFQSQNVAAPLETSQADKIDVVVESSAPRVIQLETKDKDGGSITFTNVCDFEGKETKRNIEYPVSSEAYYSVLVSEFHDATENLQDASDDAASSVMMDKAMGSSTTEPCDLDLKAAESSNAENAVFINVDVPEDHRDLELEEDNDVLKIEDLDLVVTSDNKDSGENKEIAVLNEDDAPGKTEDAFQGDEVEAAVQYKEDAVSEDTNEIKKTTLEAVAGDQITVELNEVGAPEKTEEPVPVDELDSEIEKNALEAVAENQVNAAPNELDAPEKAVQTHEVEAAAESPEDAFSEDTNEIKKTTLEAVVRDQITVELNEVGAPEKTEEPAPVDELEAVISAKLAVDYQTHDAVLTELVPPEVGKQLKEIKEIVEDVLNRVNALLNRN